MTSERVAASLRAVAAAFLPLCAAWIPVGVRAQSRTPLPGAVPCPQPVVAAAPSPTPSTTPLPLDSPRPTGTSSPLRVSPSKLQLNAGGCARLTVSGGSPPYTTSSGDAAVAILPAPDGS